MIYVYTGNGKGKTTAAIGAGIRAVGAGKKVLMVQFMKVKERTSEYYVIQKLKDFDIESFGREGFYLPKEYLEKNPEAKKFGVKPLSDIDFKLAQDGFDFIVNALKNQYYHLIILDELCVALNYGLLKEKDILNILKKYKEDIHFIITGRNCPDSIMEIADLITEMREIKHYYKEGKKAVKGIDF